MTRESIQVEIDGEVARKAEAVYNALGMDTGMAVSMFIRRTAMLGAMPMSMEPIGQAAQPPRDATPQAGETAPAQAGQAASPHGQAQGRPPAASRTNTAITQDMVEAVWDAYLEMGMSGRSANAVAEDVSHATGMNVGSAFIYLVILENLEAGKPNTRNMKMKDLAYYMGRIRDELGEAAYANAVSSLRASIPYWDKPQFGRFADRVRGFLDSQA